ncbi:hypothetical protein K6119_00720 [Paracrocinitomix mangrovi]|uniref:hypothetical protein n=1 Tax=Paracrocinitomix mangrovi TaxID=2862509 RepID=UPI001C8E9C4B|nr:hypothetical protein [Paracrocinitomix mangrovi]UKN02036.1 hypothetical protein K6119_00720 [Paracrocinitomix mangrovi]
MITSSKHIFSGIFILFFIPINSISQTTDQQKQEVLYEQATPLIESGNYAGAVAKMQEAYDACPTCADAMTIKLQIDAMGQLTKLDDMKYTCSNIPTDQGVNYDFHKSNVGKILFSKTEIVKEKETSGMFETSFTTADNIYSRVYLPHSVQYECANMGMCFNNASNVMYRWTVDGGSYSFSKSYYSDGTSTFNGYDQEVIDQWTTWQPGLSPSSAEGYSSSDLQFFYSMLEFLPEGKHQIKLEIYIDIPEDEEPTASRSEQNCHKYTTKFGAEKVLASGEFTLNVKESDKSKVKTKTGTLSKAELDKKNQDAFIGTMESSGIWLINKCSEAVTVNTGNCKTTVKGNSSTRITLKKGSLITTESGVVLQEITSDCSSTRLDVPICN